MESLSENRPLLWSIGLSGLAIVGLLMGSSPEFNEQFALVDIPTEVSLHVYNKDHFLNAIYFVSLLIFVFSFTHPSTLSSSTNSAVQAGNCPGARGGLCRCSAG